MQGPAPASPAWDSSARSTRSPESRTRVQSRSGFIDDPRSDANGRLRAVVEPGERTYAVGYIPESAGYRRPAPEKRVRLPAGGTVTVQFELEK